MSSQNVPVTTGGAIRAHLAEMMPDLAVYRDTAPDGTALPVAVIYDSLSVSTRDLGDDITLTETIQVDLFQPAGDGYGLADALHSALHKASIGIIGSQVHRLAVIDRSIDRGTDPDEDVVRTIFTLTATRRIDASNTNAPRQPILPSHLSEHIAQTTNVHGIANTADLETHSGAQAKADAAQTAAEAYADAVSASDRAAAEANAAADATAKADAAQAAAIAAAATDASSKADAAEAAAIAAAATDASSKADAAQAAAIAAAATDASSKADAAQAAAIAAAATDASSKADAARNNAVATAATDATTKANNARTAAISAAATDATTKANNARTAAISTAAADASTKANNARTEAIAIAADQAAATYIPLIQRGEPNGTATLDGNGKVPSSQLPSIALTSTYVVGSQEAQAALSPEAGDIAIRTDLSKSFIYTGSAWQELLTPTDTVTSVEGRIGAVSLSDLYDASGSAAAAQAAAAIDATNKAIAAQAAAATDATTKANNAMTDAIAAAATDATTKANNAKAAAITAAAADASTKATFAREDAIAAAATDATAKANAAKLAAVSDANTFTITKTDTAEANAKAYTDTKDAAHVSATDPHGDRAYAVTKADAAQAAATAAAATDATTKANNAQAAAIAAAATDATTKANTAEANANAYADTKDAAHVSATDPHGDRAYADGKFVPASQKGAASGVATLDGAGKIPNTQLPALAITSTFVVASQAAQDALTVQEGDVAVRTDLSKSFIYTGSAWQELLTPADAVTSVEGRTGVVSLADLYDSKGSASAAQAAAIAAAATDATTKASNAQAAAIAAAATDATTKANDAQAAAIAAAATDATTKANTAETNAKTYTDGQITAIGPRLMPAGGTAGQILAKNSSADYDDAWIDFDAQRIIDYGKAGVAISAGQAVYITGATGANPILGLASSSSEATSDRTLGLMLDTVAVNGQGRVVLAGDITGINTSAAADGDPVWLGSTPGSLVFGQANRPLAPNHSVYLGVVTRAHATQGVINVRVQPGFEIDKLHDVSTSGVANQQALVYESSTSLWKPGTPRMIAAIAAATAGTVIGNGTENNLYTLDGSTGGTISLGSAPAIRHQVHFVQTGTGTWTFAGDTGVTVGSYGGLTLAGQWASCTAIKLTATSWLLIGAMK